MKRTKTELITQPSARPRAACSFSFNHYSLFVSRVVLPGDKNHLNAVMLKVTRSSVECQKSVLCANLFLVSVKRLCEWLWVALIRSCENEKRKTVKIRLSLWRRTKRSVTKNDQSKCWLLWLRITIYTVENISFYCVRRKRNDWTGVKGILNTFFI